MTTTGTNTTKSLHLTSRFSYIKFMIYSFSAPITHSITTYDSYTISIPTATPRSLLTVAPTEDITIPAPTITTNDYRIHVHIPGSSLIDIIPPLAYHAPPTFEPTAKYLYVTNI